MTESTFHFTHYKLDAYRVARELADLVMAITPQVPEGQGHSKMVGQIVRSATGAEALIAEGAKPVAEFNGNAAWLEIARLAWNMAKWIAQLVLPKEVVRWEWKRFRLHYTLVQAQLIKRARQTWVRLMGASKTIDPLMRAFDSL